MGREERSQMLERYLKVAIASQIGLNRRVRGWSQKELAEKAGIKQAQVSRIEKGQNLPNLETLRKLASALDVALMVQFPRGWRWRGEEAEEI